MKRTIAALTCATALATSLTACSGQATKSSLPLYTPATSPSTTATSTPTTPPTTAGPVALAAHTTYTYGGLKVIVNLPADIPRASERSTRLFTEFLKANARTTALHKLDPALAGLASADIVKLVQSEITPGSTGEIGSVIYKINDVQTAGTSGVAVITGCLDQSKLLLVRKDGSHFVGALTKKYPTLKMTADINPSGGSPKVTGLAFVAGSC